MRSRRATGVDYVSGVRRPSPSPGYLILVWSWLGKHLERWRMKGESRLLDRQVNSYGNGCRSLVGMWQTRSPSSMRYHVSRTGPQRRTK